jgi:hypothetical protein
MLEKTLQHSNLDSQSQIIYIIDLLFKSDCSIEDLKTMCVSKEYWNLSYSYLIMEFLHFL